MTTPDLDTLAECVRFLLTRTLVLNVDDRIRANKLLDSLKPTPPAPLNELREKFQAGQIPTVSLRMMDKRKGMCRACSL